MKTLLMTALALSAFAANAHIESAAKYKFSGDISYASFCRAVVTDDVELLKRSIRHKVGTLASSSHDVLRKVVAEDGIKCNNTDIVEFSKQRQAKQVYAFFTQAE